MYPKSSGFNELLEVLLCMSQQFRFEHSELRGIWSDQVGFERIDRVPSWAKADIENSQGSGLTQATRIDNFSQAQIRGYIWVHVPHYPHNAGTMHGFR